VGAQEGRPWREIQRERRTELLLRLDDLGQAPR
jgi:DNA transformation protein and related proteins